MSCVICNIDCIKYSFPILGKKICSHSCGNVLWNQLSNDTKLLIHTALKNPEDYSISGKNRTIISSNFTNTISLKIEETTAARQFKNENRKTRSRRIIPKNLMEFQKSKEKEEGIVPMEYLNFAIISVVEGFNLPQKTNNTKKIPNALDIAAGGEMIKRKDKNNKENKLQPLFFRIGALLIVNSQKKKEKNTSIDKDVIIKAIQETEERVKREKWWDGKSSASVLSAIIKEGGKETDDSVYFINLGKNKGILIRNDKNIIVSESITNTDLFLDDTISTPNIVLTNLEKSMGYTLILATEKFWDVVNNNQVLEITKNIKRANLSKELGLLYKKLVKEQKKQEHEVTITVNNIIDDFIDIIDFDVV